MIVENNKYFKKYQKYKRKYTLLKYNQVGGKDIDNINNIKKLYEYIPDSGLYNNELSSEDRIKQFKKFCDYLYDKTKNNAGCKNLLKQIKISVPTLALECVNVIICNQSLSYNCN